MKSKIPIRLRKILQPLCVMLLSSCAANFQPPPLSATNPASVEAQESVRPAARPTLGPDALTQKTNEQLAATTPGTPSFQPSDMQQMHHGATGQMGGMHHHHSNMPQMEAADKKSATTKSYYTCPMHPQIHESNPGNCPICGMALIKKEDVK